MTTRPRVQQIVRFNCKHFRDAIAAMYSFSDFILLFCVQDEASTYGSKADYL